MSSDNKLIFKVVIIGDHLVGKTQLVKTYVNESEVKDDDIGVVFKIKDNIKINDNNDNELNVKLQLFDFNGGCRFLETIPPLYYKHANAFMVCYSKDNIKSYDSLINYINNINSIYDPSEKNFISDKPSILIAGLKSDIPPNEVQVDSSEALKYCDSLIIPSIHTISSKDNIDIDKLFQTIAQLIYNNGSYSNNNYNKKQNNKCIIN